LNYFPVLLDITDGDLAGKALGSGDDIVFTDNAAAKLAHEIEFYDNSTGHLIAWINVPTISSSVDTILYMYYGYVNSSNQESQSQVWSSNFTMVHHLEETSGTHIDSTLRGNDGTTGGVVNASAVGYIDGAVDFNGVTGSISIPHSTDVTGFNDSFSATFWVRIDTATFNRGLLNKYDPNNETRGWYIHYWDWGPYLVFVASENGSSPQQWWSIFTPNNGSWQHIAIVWQSGLEPNFYVNGTQLTTLGTGNPISEIYNNNATVLYLAQYYQFWNMDGILDEVRIAKAARNSAWIAAEYRNQFDPATFYTLSAEQTGQQFYITASTGSGGSIQPSGVVAVQEATNKTFYIYPDDGYHILDVLVDSFSEGVPFTYTFNNLNNNHTIEAQFEATTPPIISLSSQYDKGDQVTITITGGTSDKPLMLQINNPSGTEVWADQENFLSDGSYTYQFKIPSSWGYGTYLVYVMDVDAGTVKSANLNIKAPTPPSPPPPPPPPLPVNELPIADAGPDQTALVGRRIFFDGSGSKDSDGTILTYIWIFGDGETASGVTTSHAYISEGEFTVELATLDNLGGTGSDTANITVKLLPLEPETGVDEKVGADETKYLVNATEETETTITVNTTDHVTVSVLEYGENPYPEIPIPENSLPTIVDVFVSNHASIIWPIYVERHYTDSEIEGLEEMLLAMYYYSDGAWHLCRETGVYPDINVVWANMYEDEVLGSPIMIGERPSLASFQFSDLKISQVEVRPDELVSITVEVTNVGGDPGDYNATLLIDGTDEETVLISLGVGESIRVTYNVSRNIDGTYLAEVGGLSGSFIVYTPTPAEFQLSGFDLSSTIVAPDEQIQGSVMIKNIGELAGSYAFQVQLDGVVIHLSSITLEGGESRIETFLISSDQDGSHTVEVDGLSGTFTVERAPADFEYEILDLTPKNIESGDTVTVNIQVSNIGETRGTYDYDLSLDGEIVDSATGQLDAGETTVDVFIITSEAEGTHTIEIEGLLDSFTVTEPEQPQRFPWILVDGFIIVAVIVIVYYLRQWEYI
jgi:hypothetical protein